LAPAAIEFSRNLGLAAIPETIGGLTIVMPIALGLYRGWVGGIVSVDHLHQSRLRTAGSALVDVAWIYVLVVPLFAIGSMWEYFYPGA
jgi:hypothetical protein